MNLEKSCASSPEMKEEFEMISKIYGVSLTGVVSEFSYCTFIRITVTGEINQILSLIHI